MDENTRNDWIIISFKQFTSNRDLATRCCNCLWKLRMRELGHGRALTLKIHHLRNSESSAEVYYEAHIEFRESKPLENRRNNSKNTRSG